MGLDANVIDVAVDKTISKQNFLQDKINVFRSLQYEGIWTETSGCSCYKKLEY